MNNYEIIDLDSKEILHREISTEKTARKLLRLGRWTGRNSAIIMPDEADYWNRMGMVGLHEGRYK